jgi:lincosamide nucleotidyltransferase A/C/D/E
MGVVSDDTLSAGPGPTAADVLELLAVAADLGAMVWLDGGWGVDALLGRQTRPHGDIDIVVEERNVNGLVRRLKAAGYAEIRDDEARDWNFVLGHPDGRVVDFHVIMLDVEGNGIYGPAENGEQYPAAALAGMGVVAGRDVRCISPQSMVAFHTGYLVDEKDWSDVSALCDKFGLPVPAGYRRWQVL